MTEQQTTFVESYLAEHTHDMDSQEEVQAQAEEAIELFKELEKTLDQLRGILASANNGKVIEDIYEECQETIWVYLTSASTT